MIFFLFFEIITCLFILKQLFASGSVNIGEYSRRLRLGEYSPIITSPSANNCLLFVLKPAFQSIPCILIAHIINRKLQVSSKIWILCSRGNCLSNIKFIFSRHCVVSSIYTTSQGRDCMTFLLVSVILK